MHALDSGGGLANSLAIRAVSEAIRTNLETARVGTPFPTATISVVQTSDFAANLPATGVTIYLHRIAIHTSVRNLPPRLAPDGARFRPSFPLDLHYLLTAWAPTASLQQDVLGWMIRTMEDTPTLPTALLNQSATVFREGETVDVVAQPLSPVELVAVWEFNKALMQPSMTYMARMVNLDSAVPFPEAGRVQTRGTVIDRSQP